MPRSGPRGWRGGALPCRHPVNLPHLGAHRGTLCHRPDIARDHGGRRGCSAGRPGARLLTREVEGFVLNRLQAVLLAELLWLVADGVVSVEGLDDTIRHGLGRRWGLHGAVGNHPAERAGRRCADYIRAMARCWRS